MSNGPTIKRLKKVTGAGVFQNYVAEKETLQLRQFNLIYGFNGSGKTTISRVLSSVQSGEIHHQLPESITFEVELSDGSVIKSAQLDDKHRNRILVFNKDFISENLRWSEGTANPIFFIGKAQADSAAQLEKLINDSAKLGNKLNELKKEEKRDDKEFREFKKATAKAIHEFLRLGNRKYEAPALARDYENEDLESTATISEDRKKSLHDTLGQDVPLAKRNVPSSDLPDLKALCKVVEDSLNESIGSVSVQEVKEHKSMVNWLETGVDYHREHKLKKCLLCGNKISNERLDHLSEAIDDRFKKFVQNINDIKEQIESAQEVIQVLKNTLPPPEQIDASERAEFKIVKSDMNSECLWAEDLLSKLLKGINAKIATPTVKVDTSEIPDNKEINKRYNQLVQKRSDIFSIIGRHNSAFDQFDTLKKEAESQLKRHFLKEYETDYQQKMKKVADSNAELEKLKQEMETLQEEIGRLKKEVQQHGPAADEVNKLLHNYLGHEELSIVPVEEGYLIHRNGQTIKGTLSEGEMTAFALCYFLLNLKAEGRKKEELIVVIDDPVSSLDSKAMNYAFSLIKRTVLNAKQVIILTHNLHFMNSVKRWFKKKNEKEKNKTQAVDVQATLMFLEVRKSRESGIRSAALKEMSRLLRDYESEYHYLFACILEFVSMADDEDTYFYLLPNALRKVLETFLEFKCPGPSGFVNKIEEIGKIEGMDEVRLHALERLTQVESHGDNVDDVLSFSSLTIEEIEGAAEATLHLIEKLDPNHFNRMKKLCA